eukprot:IDg13562t1
MLDGRFIKFVNATDDNPDTLFPTPSKVNTENVNPLDALALVASSTPRSYTRVTQSRTLPHDPIVQDWISQLTKTRGQCEGYFQTIKLTTLISDHEWRIISARVRRLLQSYASSGNGIELCIRKKKEVVCIYFQA